MAARKFSALFVIFILVFSSCTKQKRKPNWSVDALGPLLKTSLNINDLVNSNELQSDSIGRLKLVLQDTLYSLQLDSLVNFPDTVVKDSVIFAFTPTYFPGNVNPVAIEKEAVMDLKGPELTAVNIQSGAVRITVSSSFDVAYDLIYEQVSATKDGSTFLITEPIPAGTISSPSEVTRTYALDGYQIDLTGNTGNGFNTIVSSVSTMIPEGGETLHTVVGDFIRISYQFLDLKPSLVKGYFGQFDASITSSGVEFDFPSDLFGENINLEDLDMKLTVSNNIGVEIQTQINDLSVSNSTSGTSKSLTAPFVGSTININRAQATGNLGNPVIPSNHEISINPTNSNIEELLDIQPNHFSFQSDMSINPLGNVSSHNDFIFGNYGVDILLDMELPISIAFNSFSLCDTVDFNLGEKTIDDRYLIANGFLYLYGTNSYPFKITPQLHLLDENYLIIDSLITSGEHFESGILNSQNIVEESTTSKITIPISPEKISNLYRAHFIKMDMNLATSGFPDFVTIYNHYSVDLQLIGDFNYKVDLTKDE